MPILACGGCVDAGIASYVPFVIAWTMLFAGWCLFWGLSASRLARDCGQKLAVNPGRSLLGAILVSFVTVPLTMGSCFAPMVIFLPIWLLSLYYRRPAVPVQAAEPSRAGLLAHSESKMRRVVLCLSLVLIPVSYIFLLVHAWL